VKPDTLAILNPQAGGGRAGTLAPGALNWLRAAGVSLEVAETHGPGHAKSLARGCYADGWRRFLAVGGDGTTFEVANGLLAAQAEAGDGAERPLLGSLPLGTGNSFLRDFGVDSTEAALDRIVTGRSRAVDVLRLTHADGVLYSLNLISVGFVAEVCALANARFKGLGERGYTAATLAKLVRLRARAFPMRVDGGPEDRAPLALASFCNSRFTGGTMEMAPAADPCDGEGDLIRMEAVGRLALVGAFKRIFAGTHVELPSVDASRFQVVEFDLAEAAPVMLDGEVLDLRIERIEVVPGALDVLV
jgi:diacylglycerol kinase family enzyme